MAHFRSKHYLSAVYVFILLLTVNTAFSQSDAQRIIDSLRSDNQELAQTYMERITRTDASRLQCNLLVNFNYIFDYNTDLFNRENMQWVLDGFKDKGYSWPSSCDFRRQETESKCLIYGNDLSPNQANLLKEVFEGLINCPIDNLNCVNAHNHYLDAVYTDTYLYVVERFFSEANLADITRSSCEGFNSWAQAIARTHTGYFNLGWGVFSDFQLASGSRSLQKSLDSMQSIVSIDESSLRDEYNFQLENLADTDSAGARAKYRMIVSTLRSFTDN